MTFSTICQFATPAFELLYIVRAIVCLVEKRLEKKEKKKMMTGKKRGNDNTRKSKQVTFELGYIGFDIYLNFQQNKIKLKMKQNCHVSSSN